MPVALGLTEGTAWASTIGCLCVLVLLTGDGVEERPVVAGMLGWLAVLVSIADSFVVNFACSFLAIASTFLWLWRSHPASDRHEGDEGGAAERRSES